MNKDVAGKQKFAVFDVDGTIARTGLFFQVIDELIAAGHLPRESRSELDKKLELYRNRKHDNAYGDYVQAMVDVLFSNLRTLKVTDYRMAVDRVIKRTKQATYVYTRDLARQLKADGYFLIALSGSEMYSVQEFTKHFGFDLAVGETYHEVNGKFSGEIEDVAHSKYERLHKIIQECNLDTKGSVGVGDTRGDIGIFEHVETPIVFNPEKFLFDYAKEQGWKIVIERKNTVITLERKNGEYVLV